MSSIQKGKITSIEKNKARVISSIKKGDVSKPLKIADGIDTANLSKGMEVAYVVFEDMSGIILSTL